MKDFNSSVDYIEKKHLIINRDYVEILEGLQFLSFESVWRFSDGEIIKKIKERSVIRLGSNPGDVKRSFYLKRHNLEFIGFSKLLPFFFSRRCVSQGRLEFENICSFRNHDLPTVVPVGMGERIFRFFWAESFLITENFSPFVSLEDLLRDNPQELKGPKGEIRKRILLNEIALLARKMHGRGFNHLDFNATHILLHYEKGSDIPKLALFDLQRVDKRTFLRFRWKIKSLARLIFSLPDSLFKEDDGIHLFLSYQGKDKFNFLDRIQWYWIKRKTAKISRHTKNIMARKKATDPNI